MATPAGLITYTPGLNGFGASNFTGAGGSGAGSWATFSDTGSWNGTGGYGTSADGDQVNLVVPNNAKAVYALLRVNAGNSGAIAGASTVVRFKVLRDNVVQGDDRAALIGSYGYPALALRYLYPISRYGAFDWSSAGGNHVLSLAQRQDGNSQTFQVDGFLVVTSKAVADAQGDATFDGDSWTAHGGSTHSLSSYAPKVARMLTRLNGYEVKCINLGVNGDMQWGQDATKNGGMFRLATNFVLNPTRYFIWAFGTNDLSQGHEEAYIEAMFNSCCFMEDTIDVSRTKIVLCTPGFRSPIMFMPTKPLVDIDTLGSTDHYYSGSLEATMASVELVKMMPNLFPRLQLGIADWWGVMNYDVTQVASNASRPRDGGNHANDRGTQNIAVETTRACVGTRGGVSWQ